MAWYCDWGVFGYQRWPWLQCRLALWLVKWVIWLSGHGHFQVIYSDYIYIHILCHCITTLSPLQQSVLVIKSYFCWLMFTFCWLNTLFNHHFFLVVIPWKTSSGESREQLTIMWKMMNFPLYVVVKSLCWVLFAGWIHGFGWFKHHFCWLNPNVWPFMLVKPQRSTATWRDSGPGRKASGSRRAWPSGTTATTRRPSWGIETHEKNVGFKIGETNHVGFKKHNHQ